MVAVRACRLQAQEAKSSIHERGAEEQLDLIHVPLLGLEVDPLPLRVGGPRAEPNTWGDL